MRELQFLNRQKSRVVKIPLLRRITRHLLENVFALREYQLGIHLVDSARMAEVNETFLGHTGSTDVITFDYQETEASPPLHGEIFISIDDAIGQAREFQTSWQEELVRYIIHGTLHLRGHDDLQPVARRAMKREENRLVKDLSSAFALGKLGAGQHAGKSR